MPSARALLASLSVRLLPWLASKPGDMNTGSKAIAGSHVQPHTAANRQCFLIDYYAKELNLPCRARAFTFFFFMMRVLILICLQKEWVVAAEGRDPWPRERWEEEGASRVQIQIFRCSKDPAAQSFARSLSACARLSRCCFGWPGMLCNCVV